MDLAFISLIYGGMCVFVIVCAYVYCLFARAMCGRVLGKGNVLVTGRVSSCYSLLNRELLFFFRGGVVQGLVGDESDHQTRHISADQLIAKFVCKSQVKTSTGHAHL